jgi:signal transduction histidine kinase/DNA-binding response OmpR family regulator
MATPLNILIAEDSPDDTELIMGELRHAGFDVKWHRVETEADFLAGIKQAPDIILSDFSMPRFNGLRAVELLKTSGLDIPFILVSGTIGEEAAVKAMKLGVTDYLLKDRIVHLGKTVVSALEQKRLRDERKQTIEELHWKTTLLEAQLESSIDGILVVDKTGKQVLQNRRMTELWKIPEHIVQAKDEAAQVAFATSQTKDPEQFIKRVAYLYAHPEEIGRDEIELIDGTILDRYSAPVRDTAGNHYGRIWSFRDITEKRKLEAQFRQAQKMESIGLLAGGIAHDFNNILAAIMGNNFLAKGEAKNNPELMEYLEEIQRASERASDLVGQILTFSRRNKQDRSPVKLNQVVLEALKLLRASVPAIIRIQTELTETPCVLANATAIHQVMMNLGTNAWHAMGNQQGTLKVEMGVLDVDQDFAQTRPELHVGSYVKLSVSDTGCGMNAATLEHIFDPFFTTKPVGEGTGLGLSVVHGIMKSHDGGISVYSQPGKGTTFNLYFPVLESETPTTENESSSIPRGKGEHILLVDDEEILASMGKRMLEKLGYCVTTKTSPLEAIAAVRDRPEAFDLVITDLTMPVMDGLKLGGQLLKIQPQLAILLTTGHNGAMTAERVRALGFRELLPKPSTARNLGEAVHRALHPAP